MARKTKQKKFEEEIEYQTIKWDVNSLRPSYRKDYDKYSRLKSPLPRRKQYFYMVKKYGFYPTNYKHEYADLVALSNKCYENPYHGVRLPPPVGDDKAEAFLYFCSPNNSSFVKVEGWCIEEIDKVNPDRIKFRDAFDQNKMIKARGLRVLVNLMCPKEKLIREVEEMVRRYQRVMDFDPKKKDKRKRLPQYRDYLSVYRSKEIDGEDWVLIQGVVK